MWRINRICHNTHFSPTQCVTGEHWHQDLFVSKKVSLLTPLEHRVHNFKWVIFSLTSIRRSQYERIEEKKINICKDVPIKKPVFRNSLLSIFFHHFIISVYFTLWLAAQRQHIHRIDLWCIQAMISCIITYTLNTNQCVPIKCESTRWDYDWVHFNWLDLMIRQHQRTHTHTHRNRRKKMVWLCNETKSFFK